MPHESQILLFTLLKKSEPYKFIERFKWVFSISTRTLIINNSLYARYFNEIEISCIYSAVAFAIEDNLLQSVQNLWLTKNLQSTYKSYGVKLRIFAFKWLFIFSSRIPLFILFQCGSQKNQVLGSRSLIRLQFEVYNNI